MSELLLILSNVMLATMTGACTYVTFFAVPPPDRQVLMAHLRLRIQREASAVENAIENEEGNRA